MFSGYNWGCVGFAFSKFDRICNCKSRRSESRICNLDEKSQEKTGKQQLLHSESLFCSSDAMLTPQTAELLLN